MSIPKARKRELPVAVVIDDDAAFRNRLARALTARDFVTHEAAGAAEGLAVAHAQQPALITLDLRMPGGSGLDSVAELAALACKPCILLLTGYGSIPSAVEAVKRGAADVLTKPVNADQIVAAYAKFAQAKNPDRQGGDAGAGFLGKPSPPSRSGFFWDQNTGETPTLPQVEWDHIQRVLADCGGNISEAARRLGLHRRSLQRKLEKRAG